MKDMTHMLNSEDMNWSWLNSSMLGGGLPVTTGQPIPEDAFQFDVTPLDASYKLIS